jgi:hypothetical protein
VRLLDGCFASFAYQNLCFAFVEMLHVNSCVHPLVIELCILLVSCLPTANVRLA